MEQDLAPGMKALAGSEDPPVSWGAASGLGRALLGGKLRFPLIVSRQTNRKCLSSALGGHSGCHPLQISRFQHYWAT